MANLVNLSSDDTRRRKIVPQKQQVYIDIYDGLPTHQRAKQVALNSSDQGRCWWIHDFLFHNDGGVK